jgi:cellulose synthase/poly-beta-1,6-N-acetylglucosamine synthase-like glycosyltransferase
MTWLTILAAAVLAFVVCSTLIQGIVVTRFVRIVRCLRDDPRIPVRLPATTVVLPLRGADPWLPETLRALASQDYPDYEVRVILDSPGDTARDVLDAWIVSADCDRFHVEILHHHMDCCSRKNQALIQAVRTLPEDREVVAILDGDVIPHATWLRDLVVPLMNDPRAGAATGNRWYKSDGRQWGTRVRYFWNAGAVVQMWFNQMAWAGSLALKTSVIHETGMLDRWGRAISTDAVVYRQLQRHGYRCVFAESVLMLNQEEIALPKFVSWVARQLTTARLYHPGWTIVLFHALYLFFILACAPLALGLALGTAESLAATVLGLVQVVYWGASYGFARALESAVRNNLRRHQATSPDTASPGEILVALAGMVLTQTVYLWALLLATGNRTVTWRGVQYRISGPFEIKTLAFEPYAQQASGQTSLV